MCNGAYSVHYVHLPVLQRGSITDGTLGCTRVKQQPWLYKEEASIYRGKKGAPEAVRLPALYGCPRSGKARVL